MPALDLKNIFVGIGVARPNGMEPLPGVQSSITQMASWAERQNYAEIVTVCDDEEQVTPERIRAALVPLLHSPINRIVIFFVGHGFQDQTDQLWILSDGPGVNTGRVSRNQLRASLETYRPKQIAMLSDACLISRYFPSGTVPILADQPGHHDRVFVDNIYSALPNDPSYFFHAEGGSSEFCLFTSVLFEFLQGTHPDAFRLSAGSSPDVTTQTLYWNLPRAVRQRAATLHVGQEPRIEPGFPFGLDIYSRFNNRDVHAATPPGPPDESNVNVPTWDSKARPNDLDTRLNESSFTPLNLPSRNRMRQIVERAESIKYGLVALVHHSGRFRHWRLLGNDRKFWYPIQRGYGGDRPYAWAAILDTEVEHNFYNQTREYGSLLAIDRSNGYRTQLFTMIPIFNRLTATVHLQQRPTIDGILEGGCYQLSWFRADPNYLDYESYSETTNLSWKYLMALDRGTLTSLDAQQIAHSLREGKHINPMIGVVCAYLYDLVGDVNSIARMCHFYKQHDQPIPFDIALLSRGELRRSKIHRGWELSYNSAPREDTADSKNLVWYLWDETPEGTAPVAGMGPLIRSGWNRLSALSSPDKELLNGIASLTSSLTSAPIATIAGRDNIKHAVELLRALNLLT